MIRITSIRRRVKLVAVLAILAIFVMPVGEKFTNSGLVVTGLIVVLVSVKLFVILKMPELIDRARFLETDFYKQQGPIAERVYKRRHSVEPLTNSEMWLMRPDIEDMRAKLQLEREEATILDELEASKRKDPEW